MIEVKLLYTSNYAMRPTWHLLFFSRWHLPQSKQNRTILKIRLSFLSLRTDFTVTVSLAKEIVDGCTQLAVCAGSA